MQPQAGMRALEGLDVFFSLGMVALEPPVGQGSTSSRDVEVVVCLLFQAGLDVFFSPDVVGLHPPEG